MTPPPAEPPPFEAPPEHFPAPQGPDPFPVEPDLPPRGVTREDVFSLLGTLGAVLTMVTAVMFYFGWQRSAVQAREMSIDVSLFGFTSQDYILRSISALYLPLLVSAALGLGWLWIHARVLGLLRSPALAHGRRRDAAALWSRRIAVGAGVLAAVCIAFALLAGTTAPPAPVIWLATGLRARQWVVPLVLVTATSASAYAWWFHRRLRPAPRVAGGALWQSLLPVVLVAGTVTLGVFWMLEEYASAVGRGYARQLAAGVGSLARAVVISPYPLGIEAPGVVEEVLAADGESGAALYRTTGLRLLARSGGKVILVHDGWAPGVGTVVVLADTDALTWQFSR